MGVLDKTNHKLTCPKCGMSEVATVLDKGSQWSGAHWQNGPALEQFDVKWVGGGMTEPAIAGAECKRCRVPASVDVSS